MSKELVKAIEIEPITALAAKSLARVLEAEKRGKCPVPGHLRFDSVEHALSASPEDLTWNAIVQFEDENPGSFAILWENVKQYAQDELESGQRAASVAIGDDRPITRARFLVLREKYITEWQPRNVLRALRDLRRYTTPVIVNNQGGQVNVAADGSRAFR